MTENLQQQKSMGEEAARLLENPALQEVFKRCETEIHQAWIGCSARDVEGQRLLLQQAKVLEQMKGIIVRMVEQGKHASSRLPISDILGENMVQRGMRDFRNRRNPQ